MDQGELAGRIRDNTAVVGICGLGYVGLPLARAVAARGFRVVGFDIDPAKVETLNAGRSYIGHIADTAVAEMREAGTFEATVDFARVGELDIIVICVPTPLNRHREPDLSFVTKTAAAIAENARPGQLVILESTTYPGTTVEVLAPIFGSRGLESGKDIFLAFSPEREDPGNVSFQTATIPKVVGGDGPVALELASAFYGKVVNTVVPVPSAATAEAVKLTENVFRAVNIALVNELKIVYSAMGIDVWEVIEAAKTKPFGFMPFYPGPGLGGHCIPIDPFYLTWKAREFGIDTRFIELAGQINTSMPRYVVDRLAGAVDRRLKKGLNGAKILVIGVAYKKNVDDMRESPSLRLIELLEARGATTSYHDPLVPRIPKTREHAALANRESVPLDAAAIEAHDAVLVATDHDGIDYVLVADKSKLVIDTRNVFGRMGIVGDNIVKA